MSATDLAIPDRWETLTPHPEQFRLMQSDARFRVVYAGRRSGKSELPKRMAVQACIEPPLGLVDFTAVMGAPTHQQAKRIHWNDLKRLSPRSMISAISESELTIHYVTGAKLIVAGMDKPMRVEGFPIDWLGLDEYADMKPDVWEQHLRPSLSTPGRPPGRAVFFGTPDGRNHFFELVERARTLDDWEVFHWKSAEIMDAAEIADAKRDLDPLSYQQEYEASFVTFAGRCYYPFDRAKHCTTAASWQATHYQANRPLIFALDFNVDPGSAVVLQESDLKWVAEGTFTERFTAQIGEVAIPKNSTTASVCRKLIADWKHHEGDVYVYGDPSGGARSTQGSGQAGGDWTIVREHLRPVFGGRLKMRIAKKAPPVKDRVNQTNARLESADGTIRFLIHPSCKFTIRDLEGVCWKEGADFEIDKGDDKLTHWTDALGYYLHEKYGGRKDVTIQRRAI